MLLNADPPGPPTPAPMTEEVALVRRQEQVLWVYSGQALPQVFSIYNCK